MEFDNAFEVPLAPAAAWTVLMDIRRVAPCMPGAALTEIIDPQHFRGKIAVRLGPVALAFAGRVQFEDVDEANHSARVKAQGSDDKGRGSANAVATFRIEPADIGSRVLIHTDLMLSGAVAQYGRGVGMIQSTAAQIIGQFAANLRAQLELQPDVVAAPPIVPAAAPPASAAPAPPQVAAGAAAPLRPPEPPSLPPPAKPISGLTLAGRVIWSKLVALFAGRRH